ncbi:MAG: hypothetical protein WDZ80_00600 [Candidatus Paceibacterota bacterium]
MNIFFSFSGKYSNEYALAFKAYIENVIQGVNILISSDLKGGDFWGSEIRQNLKDADYGIAFITRGNQLNTWINFEVGYIFGKEGRKCTGILLDVGPSEIHEPLKSINHKFPEKESLKNLIFEINDLLKSPRNKSVIKNAFEKNWSDFDNKVQQLKNEHNPEPDVTELLHTIVQQNKNIYTQATSAHDNSRKILLSTLKSIIFPTSILGRYSSKLNLREQELIRLYFGIDREYPLNEKEIAERFDLNISGVYEILDSALNKIKDDH